MKMLGMRLTSILLLCLLVGLGVRAHATTFLDFTGHIDVDGKPATGIKAELSLGGKVIKTETTSGSGEFSFEIPYDGQYVITLTGKDVITTTIRINSKIPSSMKKYTLIYKTSIDMFPEKEGFEAKLSAPAEIQVGYMSTKENFTMIKPYTNSVRYLPLPEKPKKEEPVTQKPLQTEPKKNETKKEEKQEPAENPEEIEVKKQMDENKQAADYRAERAMAAETEQDTKAKLEIEAVEIKVGGAREEYVSKRAEVEKMNELTEQKVAEDRAAKSRTQQKLREQIAELQKQEKQTKKP